MYLQFDQFRLGYLQVPINNMTGTKYDLQQACAFKYTVENLSFNLSKLMLVLFSTKISQAFLRKNI